MGEVLRPSRHDDYFADLLAQPAPIGLGDKVRFDHSKQQWHIWDDYRWAPDKTGRVYDLVLHCFYGWVEANAGDADAVKAMTSILDRSKKESVLKTLSTRPLIAMRGDEWDPDPWLLAFTNGVLDLRTLEFETKPDPALLLSRSTRQKYDPDAEAPRFLEFVREVTGGDAGLVTYLLSVLGYSMFGWQREQKFWLWVGQGQNGKGTLAKVMSHVLGDYAEKPSDELYMRTRFGAASSDKPRPDLLRLQGARWAWMSEPAGGQFNEELLKAHTGDDPITARDLYGKAASYTTFRPTHTLVFLTNNPPRTDDVGPSMQRRVRIFKFEQDFRGARENKGLEAELKLETRGILALLVRFAKAWHDDGELPEPPQVTEWSRDYIEENDPLSAFLTEACVVRSSESASSSTLWNAYQDWCAHRNQEPGTQTGFGLSMGRRFDGIRAKMGKVYQGVRPKTAMELAEAAE